MRNAHCTHLTNMSSMCVHCKSKVDRNDASSYISKKAPIISKEITNKEVGGNWYNSEIHQGKVTRKAENCIISTVTSILKPKFV